MTARSVAGLAGLALAFAAAPAYAATTDGNPETGPGTRPRVGQRTPHREPPIRPPPVAPDVQDGTALAPPESPEFQPVLVQGYVKTATPNELTLSAPGTTETLTVSIDEQTEVLSATGDTAIEDLRQGQLVRAALVPSGEDLVAVVVEVMPGDAFTSPRRPPSRPPTAPAPGTPPVR